MIADDGGQSRLQENGKDAQPQDIGKEMILLKQTKNAVRQAEDKKRNRQFAVFSVKTGTASFIRFFLKVLYESNLTKASFNFYSKVND